MPFIRARAIRRELDVHISDEVMVALDRDFEEKIKALESETRRQGKRRLTLPIYLGCKQREGFK